MTPWVAALCFLLPLPAIAMPEGVWDCHQTDGLSRRYRLILEGDGSFVVQSLRQGKPGPLLAAGRAEEHRDGTIFLYAGRSTFPAGPGLTFAVHVRIDGTRLTGAMGSTVNCRTAE